MFGFLSILVLVALWMFVEIAMLVLLTRRGISWEKPPWWRRSGHEAAATYEKEFPRSRLPRLRRFIFWLFPAWFAVYALMLLWKLH
jgi:hypothetical protein